MNTPPTRRSAGRLALTLTAAMTFVACSTTSTTWYRNSSEIRDAGFSWSSQDSGLVQDEDENFECETNPQNLVVWAPGFVEEPIALQAEIDDLLPEEFGELQEPVLLDGDDLWMFTVAAAETGSNPLTAAKILNQADGDLRASPDYRMFPMPAWIFFPGNLPAPADPTAEVLLFDMAAGGSEQTVHVIDTGLATGLGSLIGIDGDADERTPCIRPRRSRPRDLHLRRGASGI